ncbi:MAG: cellobiose phosphorylase, partial [Bacteriovoracaceae bacterium]|nr:cellobiose phosphorylase [Bacteriovoracaceae bacterium]
MRSSATGLVADKILVSHQGSELIVESIQKNTSPTNIAFDLMILTDERDRSETRLMAHQKLVQIISSLEKMDFHQGTGLFYAWYSSDSLEVANRNVSSIDNLHLALALWTITQAIPHTVLASRAEKLFQRMDFSIFYDETTGLVYGNLQYDGNLNVWSRENWTYSTLSETRTIYSVGVALNIFHKFNLSHANRDSVNSMKLEVYEWNEEGRSRTIPKTWDGGAFQLLLPDRLVNEIFYSTQMKSGAKNYADFILAKADEDGLPFPAAYSATSLGVERSNLFQGVIPYNGNIGSPELVYTSHREFQMASARDLWDSAVSPHAAILSLPNAREDHQTLNHLLHSLYKAEDLKSGEDHLYEPGLGWLDSFYVRGPNQGRVVPVQLAVDQEMIALSLIQMLSKDGLTPTSRALHNDEKIRSSLKYYYEQLDQKFLAIH